MPLWVISRQALNNFLFFIFFSFSRLFISWAARQRAESTPRWFDVWLEVWAHISKWSMFYPMCFNFCQKTRQYIILLLTTHTTHIQRTLLFDTHQSDSTPDWKSERTSRSRVRFFLCDLIFCQKTRYSITSHHAHTQHALMDAHLFDSAEVWAKFLFLYDLIFIMAVYFAPHAHTYNTHS